MKLTVITINYNNAAGLRKTVESVLTQTSRAFEYLVIDGGSADGSLEVICKFSKLCREPGSQDRSTASFRRCTWQSPAGEIAGGFVSERDNGIYHAMNKGVRLAQGEYVHFLNSGDWLADRQVVEHMIQTLVPGTDILVGNVISVRPDGRVRYNRNREEVSCFTFYRGTIQHTSAYIRRALFDQYGLYDETLSIVADWKWYLIVAGLNKANVQFTGDYVTCFDTTGISSTHLKLEKAERRKVLEELIPAPVLADYDKYYFDLVQMERVKKHALLYGLFWFIERCLFKWEKWKGKYRSWKKMK